MIVGWISIMKYQSSQNLPTLSTIHSWVGIIAVIVLTINYCLGCGMAVLTAWYPTFVVRQSINLRHHHRKIGGAALFLTAAAVVTGIMNQLPQGQCYYHPTDDTVQAAYDLDPSGNYPLQSRSCQIALGLGITVILGTFFGLAYALDRGDAWFAPLTTTTTTPVAAVESKTTAVGVKEKKLKKVSGSTFLFGRRVGITTK